MQAVGILYLKFETDTLGGEDDDVPAYNEKSVWRKKEKRLKAT